MIDRWLIDKEMGLCVTNLKPDTSWKSLMFFSFGRWPGNSYNLSSTENLVTLHEKKKDIENIFLDLSAFDKSDQRHKKMNDKLVNLKVGQIF